MLIVSKSKQLLNKLHKSIIKVSVLIQHCLTDRFSMQIGLSVCADNTKQQILVVTFARADGSKSVTKIT